MGTLREDGTTLSERLRQARAHIAKGEVPQWVLSDPQIFDLELENIFGKSWYFLGHESEIQSPGDYVTRWYVNDPIILLRNHDGTIHAYLNSCTHRGTMLCTADRGSQHNITCPYHGWTFSLTGDLVGVLAEKRVYGAELDKSQWGLRRIPRLESVHGLIFANLDPEAIPLTEFLGDLCWYLDILVGRTDRKMEVRGVPFRWRVPVNWKIGAENFAGDAYHTAMTHRSTVELGLSPKDPLFASYGHQIVLNGGHALNMITPSPKVTNQPPFQGLPESMWPEFERNLNTDQVAAFRETAVIDGTCFPNLSFLSPMHGAGGHGHLTNFLTLRQWRPIAPDQIEIWSWFLCDVDAPREFKDDSYRRYTSTFGPAGTLEQDDTEIWNRITDASRGLMSRDKRLNYNNVMNYVMGLGSVEPDLAWRGPGTAYPTTYLESAQRHFYQAWCEMLIDDEVP